ncbi:MULTISPECIES: hypothetical protein [unclassified Streptomyces]|uniref:hypothetical protein n=1 Tax=unclassified Streptomyces TaxID=2593676 RepID=UPI000A1FA715|nr:hypothetical protein [Streptomyces sp. 13-12-16]OSP44210.1 hypothetical protein B7767_06135 [Streptomyces sp. 13-12-16]
MSLARVLLGSGRPVDLSELWMSSTYGGPLEDYPCKPLNDRKVDRLLRSAERAFPGTPVHLIPPPREYPDQYAGAFGPVEVLPAVTCVGSFRSEALDPARDRSLYRSRLTVVWFQSSPCVPSGCDAEPSLRDLPWERLAEDGELQRPALGPVPGARGDGPAR